MAARQRPGRPTRPAHLSRRHRPGHTTVPLFRSGRRTRPGQLADHFPGHHHPDLSASRASGVRNVHGRPRTRHARRDLGSAQLKHAQGPSTPHRRLAAWLWSPSVTLRCAMGSASPRRNRRRIAGVVSVAFFLLSALAFALTACNSQTSIQPSPPPVSSSSLALVAVGEMGTPRAVHTSTRLADGRVLVAGGCTDSGCNLGSAGGATAGIYDPATGRFSPTG